MPTSNSLCRLIAAFDHDGVSRYANSQNVNVADADGLSPLEAAVRCDNATASLRLLALGANPNGVDARRTPPLHTAAGSVGSVKLASQLLAAGANSDSTDQSGRSPVFHSAEADNLEMVRLLLAAGCDLGWRDSRGILPETAAACHGHYRCFALMHTWQYLTPEEKKETVRQETQLLADAKRNLKNEMRRQVELLKNCPESTRGSSPSSTRRQLKQDYNECTVT